MENDDDIVIVAAFRTPVGKYLMIHDIYLELFS